MNKQQQSKIEWLTNLIDRQTRFVSGTNEYMNGPIVSSIEKAGDSLMLCITNSTAERKWFESTILLVAFIGKRGGVKIHHKEGIAI